MTAVDTAPGVRVRAEQPRDAAAVEALISQAFGPGRYAKTAERVREGARPRPELSLCAWAGGTLVGAVRICSIRIGGTAALFLGPIEVRPDHRRRGLAAALTQGACVAGFNAGERLVLLVGDMAVFGSLGFEPVEPGRVHLPGPVDPRRLLWRPLTPEATLGVRGVVSGV